MFHTTWREISRFENCLFKSEKSIRKQQQYKLFFLEYQEEKSNKTNLNAENINSLQQPEAATW